VERLEGAVIGILGQREIAGTGRGRGYNLAGNEGRPFGERSCRETECSARERAREEKAPIDPPETVVALCLGEGWRRCAHGAPVPTSAS